MVKTDCEWDFERKKDGRETKKEAQPELCREGGSHKMSKADSRLEADEDMTAVC